MGLVAEKIIVKNSGGRVIQELSNPIQIEFNKPLLDKNGYLVKLFYKCPDCGGLGFGHDTVRCYHCGTDIEIKKTVFAKIGCENCHDRYDITVINDTREVNCRSCRSIVDLFWHDKKKIYISGGRR